MGSCGKPDSSSFAPYVDLRTPSPDLKSTNTLANITPPSSGGKGKAAGPTWNAVNGIETGTGQARKAMHEASSPSSRKRLRPAEEDEDVDEIISVHSDDDPSMSKGKEMEKPPKKRTRSKRKQTAQAQLQSRQPAILSVTPATTMATPPPTPPSNKRASRAEPERALRSSPTSSEADSDIVPLLASGFDRFLNHPLTSKSGSDDDNVDAKQQASGTEAAKFVDRAFHNRVALKKKKTTSAPELKRSRYAARVDDESSDEETSRQPGLKPGATYILESRTPSPVHAAHSSQSPPSIIATWPADCETSSVTMTKAEEAPRRLPPLRAENDSPEKASQPSEPQQVLQHKMKKEPARASTPLHQLSEKKDIPKDATVPPLSKASQAKESNKFSSATASLAAATKEANDEKPSDDHRATSKPVPSKAAVTTQKIDAKQDVTSRPSDQQPADDKPTAAALSDTSIAGLLALSSLLQAQPADGPKEQQQHDCAFDCELCRTLATLLHRLHRSGLLDPCCGPKS